jgi:hypothetical protein
VRRYVMRRQVVSSVIAILIVGGSVLEPGIAGSATGNADQVDGFDAVGAKATLGQAAGRLVAHNKAGVIPARFVPNAGNATTLDGLDSSDLVAEIVGLDAGGSATLAAYDPVEVAALTLAPGLYLLEFHASPTISAGWGSVECSLGGRQETFWVVGEQLGTDYVHVTVRGDMTIATIVQAAVPTTFAAECWLTQTGLPGVVGAIAGSVDDVSMYAIRTEQLSSGTNV